MKNVDLKGLQNLVDLSKGYFLTTIINQALPFLLLPILTRYLSTGEYGMLSLFTFYMSISTAVIGVSIPLVISKYFYEREKEEVARLVGNCVYTALFLAIVVEVLLVVFYPLIKSYVSAPLIFLLLIPVGSFSQVVFSCGLTVCRCMRRVLHFSCHQIGNTTMNVTLSLITVCIFLWGWMGRFSSICVAFVLSALIMMVYLRKSGYLQFSFSRKLQKEIRDVIIPLIPNSVQLNMISQAGLFFMGLYFGDDILGKYAMGFQISLCVKLLSDTINMSWTPFFFQQLSLGEKMNKTYITRSLLVLIAVLVLGTLAINLLAYPVLWIMTTPDYYSASEFIPWFTLGWLLYGIYGFVRPILIKYNQQRFIGMNSLLTMIVMIVANIVAAHYLGYKGISYAFCAVYLLLTVPLILRAQKVHPLPWLKAMKIW